MKLDPRNPKMVWKKATCLKEVAPGSYEVTARSEEIQEKQEGSHKDTRAF